MAHVFKNEQLASGKVILRHFGEDGSLVDEQHVYGVLDIGIRYDFEAGGKTSETYFAKRRLVSRRIYEKARVAYPDMPPADDAIEASASPSPIGQAKRRLPLGRRTWNTSPPSKPASARGMLTTRFASPKWREITASRPANPDPHSFAGLEPNRGSGRGVGDRLRCHDCR